MSSVTFGETFLYLSDVNVDCQGMRNVQHQRMNAIFEVCPRTLERQSLQHRPMMGFHVLGMMQHPPTRFKPGTGAFFLQTWMGMIFHDWVARSS